MNIKAPITRCIEDGCTGALFDNRKDKASGKRSKKSPDFKCKEDGDHVYWIDTKKGIDPPEDAVAGETAPGSSAPEGHASPNGTGSRWVPPPSYTWAELALCYKRCVEIARRAHPTWAGPEMQAGCHTLFIAATKIGLKAPTPKATAPADQVAPPPPPPPPPPPADRDPRADDPPAKATTPHRHFPDRVGHGMAPPSDRWASGLPEALAEEDDNDLPF